MSPRRNHRRRDVPRPPREADGFGLRDVESHPDGDWVVRRISGAGAGKTYRCPGCDQEIPPGVAHLVAWRVEGGGDDRRHWHSPCWNARDRRGPRLLRSRGAPRY